MGEEGEFEKLADKWDEKGSGHNANDGEDEGGAEFVERARNPIN